MLVAVGVCVLVAGAGVAVSESLGVAATVAAGDAGLCWQEPIITATAVIPTRLRKNRCSKDRLLRRALQPGAAVHLGWTYITLDGRRGPAQFRPSGLRWIRDLLAWYAGGRTEAGPRETSAGP